MRFHTFYLLSGQFTDDPNWITNILDELSQLNEEVSNEEQEEEESSGLAKRSAWGGEVEAAEATNHTCRAEVWHCMSGVMETGIKYVERPDDIYRWIYPQVHTGVVINCSCVQRPAACSVQSSVPRRSEEHVVQRDGGEDVQISRHHTVYLHYLPPVPVSRCPRCSG